MRNTMMLPIEVSSEFFQSYEKLFENLAREAIEKVQNGSYRPYMNKKEAAQYIGISINTFQKLVKMGLPIIEVDGTKIVSKKDIDDFLEK